MPSMRKSGVELGIQVVPTRTLPRESYPRGSAKARIRLRLLVSLVLAHDFLRGEVDAAGGEGVADKEVVGLVGVVVLAVLEVRIGDDRQRQPHRLRNDLAHERVESGLDRHGHLSRAGAS